MVRIASAATSGKKKGEIRRVSREMAEQKTAKIEMVSYVK
jgi:hypothetical protein